MRTRLLDHPDDQRVFLVFTDIFQDEIKYRIASSRNNMYIFYQTKLNAHYL